MIDKIELLGHHHRVAHWKCPAKSQCTIVALHGFGTNATRSFRNVFAGFNEASIDVIAPDLLGFGESDKPEQVYDLAEYANLTAELVSAYSSTRPVLLGHSFGGKIAAATAVLHPECFSALVLVNPGGFSVYAPWLARLGGSALANILVKSSWFRESILTRTPLAHFARDSDRLAELDRFRHSHAKLDLKAGGLWGKLASISVPTLLLWGINDRILPRSTPHRIQSVIPSINIQFLTESGHVPMIDEPSMFVSAVRAFLIAHQLISEPT